MEDIKFPVSYYDAPRVAMQMVEGLNYKAFYDTIQGKNILSWTGVQILCGLMDVSIVDISHEDTNEVFEVKCKASDNNGNYGHSFISQPYTAKKRGVEEDDEDYREKAYSRAKRNACRDLVPHQVFCEMLVVASRGGQATQQQQPPPAQQTQQRRGATGSSSKQTQKAQEPLISEEMKKVRSEVRKIAVDAENNGILGVLGLSTQDAMNELASQTGIDDTEKWSVAHWENLKNILQEPVKMGMTKAVDRWNELTAEQKEGLSEHAPEEPEDDLEEGEDTNRTDPVETSEESQEEPQETSEEEEEDSEENELEALINGLNN